jgi:hypothetical protein
MERDGVRWTISLTLSLSLFSFSLSLFLSQWAVQSFPKEEFLLKQKWGEAYLRNAKKFELRLSGRQWLHNRLGKEAFFSWRRAGLQLMPFMFPAPNMAGLYGSFDTLDLFWEAFDANPAWARGFYTQDRIGDTGLQAFKDFVAKLAYGYKGSQCAWFAPQRLA